ncbi:MAG TPA: PAS domain S-box protein [Gemmatimonadaceae bacterium]
MPVRDHDAEAQHDEPAGRGAAPIRRAPEGAIHDARREREQARRYRAIFDRTTQLMVLLTLDGVILEANRTALELLGLGETEMAGRAIWEVERWPTDAERDLIRGAVREAALGRAVRHEVQVGRHDGRRAVLDFAITPVADDEGHIATLIAEGHDVTDRTLAEEALRVSEAKFAGILAIAADAIVTIDEQNTIVLFNGGAEQIFGWRAAEAIGQPLDILLPPRVGAVHRQHVSGFGAGPVSARRMGTRGEILGRRKNGEIFPAEASISRLDMGGRRLYTAVLRDITDRKRAEEERSELLARERQARTAAETAERRAALLVESSDILDRSLDYEATLRSVARLAVHALADLCVIDIVTDEGRVRRLDIAVADPAQQRLADMMRAIPLNEERPYLTRGAIRTGRTEAMFEFHPELLPGFAQNEEHLAVLQQVGPLSCMVTPLIARERTLGAIGFISTRPGRRYDEADVQLAEELARRAAQVMDNARLYAVAQRAIRARDDVLGVVSHDLRNPLSAISMCASTLLDPEPASAKNVHYLADTIMRSAEWMQRIIRDLVDVAAMEAGRLSLRRETTAVQAIVDEAATLLEPLASERSLELVTEVDVGLPEVHADPQRIVQVLSNLVGNAARFTAPGGRITIRAELCGADVQLSVEDTGAGIPAEDQPHVFDRFWHSDRGTRRHGSGLGLAIARGIVEAHGGRMWLRSTLGQGSTFYLTLPMAAPATEIHD